MNLLRMTIVAAAVLLITGCSASPGIQKAVLRCELSFEGGFYAFYSFTSGVVTPPVSSGQIDLLYYFDADDCSRGAIIGHDDRPGYLFPIGYRTWSELVALEPPAMDDGSVPAIVPLTKDKEGLGFWVKTRNGEYYLVRIHSVQSAAYSDLIAGKTATLEFEWLRPGTRKGE